MLHAIWSFSSWLQNVHWIAWTMSTNFPAALVEVTHYFSFFLVVGPIAIVDLRLLGATHHNQLPSELVRDFYPMIWIGLVITTVTGFIQAAGLATLYYNNDIFGYKLLTFACAIAVSYAIARKVSVWEKMPSIPTIAKFLAVLSILLWIGTILAGVEVPALSNVG